MSEQNVQGMTAQERIEAIRSQVREWISEPDNNLPDPGYEYEHAHPAASSAQPQALIELRVPRFLPGE